MARVSQVTRSRRTLRRYMLYQIPGWMLAFAAAVMLHRWVGLSVWGGVALVVGWAVKDAVLYPFLRTAYEPDSPSAIERLIGLAGVAVEPLAPHGYVRVRGELWRAEPHAAGIEIRRGHAVTIDAVRGTTLLVRPDSRGRGDTAGRPSAR